MYTPAVAKGTRTSYEDIGKRRGTENPNIPGAQE